MNSRMETQISFEVDADLAEKLDLALKLNKEELNKVLNRLLIQYVSDSFSHASKALTIQSAPKSSYLSNEDNNYAKANRKIPGWAYKPKQNNHRIIKAFFEIEGEMGFVNVGELAERCSNPSRYPETFSTDFRGNFAQLKTDASNSHGKVFVVNNDRVEIWSEVKKVLMDYKSLFIKSC
jgi:hypothetical protein